MSGPDLMIQPVKDHPRFTFWAVSAAGHAYIAGRTGQRVVGMEVALPRLGSFVMELFRGGLTFASGEPPADALIPTAAIRQEIDRLTASEGDAHLGILEYLSNLNRIRALSNTLKEREGLLERFDASVSP